MGEEEKEVQEPDISQADSGDVENFVDFSDLSDLENLTDRDVFGELGDISDLGDLSDLSAPGSEEAPGVEQEAVSASDAGIDDSLEGMDIGDLLGGMDGEELPELTPDDIPAEDLLGGVDGEELPELTPDDIPAEDLLGGMDGEELPELAPDDIPAEDLLGGMDGEELPELTPDDIPAEDLLGGMDGEELPELTPDDISAEDLLGGVDGEELPELTPDDIPTEDMSGALDMGDLPKELTGGEAMAEELSSSPEMNGEEPAGDTLADMALDGIGISEDGLLENLDIDFDALEESMPQDDAEGDDLGNVLDGFLDGMDMGGSGEENPAPEESHDDIAELLGLDDTFYDEGEENASPTEDMSQDMMDVSDMVPDDVPEQEKKPGFFKRVFGNIVTDEIAEQEREAAKLEAEEAEKKAEEDAKAKEEKEAQKAEKKAEKEAKAAEKKKEKEAQKAEKAKQKAEKKAKEEEEAAAELEIVGKLNKVGVCVIAIATILFLTVEIAGTNMFSYASAKKEALNYFGMGKYTDAYKAAIGTDMREKDAEEYDKIKTVMKVQQCLNAYQNYDRIQYYPEALDALLRGVKRYDANIEHATQLEVDKDLMSCRTQIISLLQTEFNLTEARAYSLLAMDKDTYQKEVIDIGVAKTR